MSDMAATRLGERIRALRYRHGLTQAQLAYKAGVGEKTLKRLETGKTDTPHPDTLAALAGALGLTTEELFEAAERSAAKTGAAVHQLPSPPRNFKGRSAELRSLQDVLQQPDIAGLCIQGMGGVGKTALALALAETLSDRYPDGQLYLDLRGASEPLKPTQAMLHVVRSLQPERAGLDTDAEVAAAYRSALHNRKLLLLLDNTAGREQLEPLVPPGGSLLISSCRQRFALPGVHALPLAPLPIGEARALLSSIAPHAQRVDEELAGLCGGLPLALSLAGRVLAERPDIAPAEFTSRLRDDSNRLAQLDDGAGGVEASFRLSYDDLDEPLQGALCQLTVFTTGFDRPAAAALWRVPEREADRRIGRLLRLNLVEFNGSGSDARYGLHDLVRLFLERRLDATAREIAWARHEEHFLGLLEECDRTFRQGEHRQALERLSRDGLNVEMAFERARNRADSDEEAALRCCRFALAGAVLSAHQHSRDRARWCAQALALAERLGRERDVGRLRVLLGRAHHNLGKPREALEHCKAGLRVAEEVGDRRTEARAMVSIADAHHALGDAEAAIRCGKQGLAIAREIEDAPEEAHAQVVLAWGYYVLGDARSSLEACHAALPLAEAISDQTLQASTLLAMGFAHMTRGDQTKANECCERCLKIARSLGDRRMEGYALLALGDAQRAKEACEQSLSIAREVGDRRIEGNALVRLGSVHHSQGEPRTAIKFYEQGLDMALETGDRRMESTALVALAFAHHALGEITEAIEVHERHVALVRNLGNHRQEAVGNFLLSAVYEAAGDIPKAAAALERSLEYQERIGHPRARESRQKLRELKQKLTQGEVASEE